MGYIRKENDGEFDFDNLPPGNYSFTGDKGIIQVSVEKNGSQKWDFSNWFESLDPDQPNQTNPEFIKEIKKRINPDTGIVNPVQERKTISFFKKLMN